MSYNVAVISETNAKTLTKNGYPAFTDTYKFFTYLDVAAAQLGTDYETAEIAEETNEAMLKLTYDAASGTYPPRNRKMFPR